LRIRSKSKAIKPSGERRAELGRRRAEGGGFLRLRGFVAWAILCAMSWFEEDEELDFEWKDEDEDEVEGDRVTLSHIRGIAIVVFLVLLLLGGLYFVLRLVSAFKQLGS